MKKFAFLVLALMASLPVHAADEALKKILTTVSKKYESLGNWEASFTQETRSIALGNSTFNEGNFVFFQPDRFKFSLTRNDLADFISNGKEAWFIQFPQGKQKPAHVKHFQDVRKIELERYLLLLRGIRFKTPADEKKLFETFKITHKNLPNGFTLTLEPLKASEIVRSELTFLNSKPHPDSLKIEDSLGNETLISVNSWKSLSKSAKRQEAKILKPEYAKDSKLERF